MISEYNQKVQGLPPELQVRVPRLTEKFDDLLLGDSGFWELDRFNCDDEWARNSKVREAIRKVWSLQRSEEEVGILVSECLRFLEWNAARLLAISSVLKQFPSKGSLASQIIQLGNRAADSIRELSKRSGFLKSLREKRPDAPNQERLECNSAPRRC